MFDGRFRAPVERAVKPLGDGLRRTGLTPDHLTILGLVMGYFGRWVDNVIGRILDAVLAIPLIVLAILILTALSAGQEGINVTSWQLIVVIGIAFTPPVARTVRSAVLAERDLDYVQAAKLRGERAPYVMFAEILPNVTGPIIVEATVRLGYAVFTIATLAFLSYGPQPPSGTKRSISRSRSTIRRTATD